MNFNTVVGNSSFSDGEIRDLPGSRVIQIGRENILVRVITGNQLNSPLFSFPGSLIEFQQGMDVWTGTGTTVKIQKCFGRSFLIQPVKKGDGINRILFEPSGAGMKQMLKLKRLIFLKAERSAVLGDFCNCPVD